ncbi:cytochrome P450, partial [Lactarius hengduanensis]
NEADIRYQDEVGDCEFKWMREMAMRGVGLDALTDRLMVADPTASKHILHSAGFITQADKGPSLLGWWPETDYFRRGLGQNCTTGQAHHRQRKIMNPAFSTHQLVQKWKEVIAADPVWPATRERAGFDFQFGSLDNLANPVVLRNDEEFVNSMLYPSWYDLIFKETWKYIPEPLLEYTRYIPTREYRGFRSWLDNVRVFSRGLIKQSTDKGDGNDIMSVLLRANGSSNPKNKMTDDEMVDQTALYVAYWYADNSTFLSAGHETIAKALAWYFYAIAKHPEAQVRIREEIALVRARATGEEFTIADLDSMAYTLATLKVVVDFTYFCESMRLDPVIWYTSRVASRDDILPLAFPITTKSGQQITSIPIKKGDADRYFSGGWWLNENIGCRMCGGEDANEWNPERFLDPLRGFKEASSNIGVFGTLMSFSSGTHGCIGWEFAVLEIQIIILALVENFEFSLPPQNEKTRIYRRPTHVMMPMRLGQKGTWMGLHIRSLN